MATLYGHGKGKSGSHPPKQEKPYWTKLKPKEAETIIVNLAKEGKTTAKIGLMLRDNYGIPNIKIFTGKKITKILEENKINAKQQDLQILEEREKKLGKHLEKNKKDRTAKRGFQFTKAKIKRLRDYHKK
ncbi:MAG: 30S ribosomal protein S15 [archaeon]|nr:MAG: 30S ribosomal protein S15 [archaeon]